MTVAMTFAFNPTILQMITDALYQIGMISEDESPSSDQYFKSLRIANYLVKEWEANADYHVWTEEEAILFLQPLQYRYLLGSPTTDHACPAFSWTQASLAAAAGTGVTVVSLVNSSGILNGDNIGIQLANQSLFWTTVKGAPNGALVTLAAPLPSPAQAGALVVDYPAGTDVTRPLKIPKARSYRYAPVGGNPSEIPMWVKSRQGYMDLPNKETPGSPIEFFYAPKMVNGELYIWQPVATQTWAVRFTWYRAISDFLLPTNTMDLPQEWASTLMWNIAREMMIGAEVPPQRAELIGSMAARKLDLLSGWDKESEDVQFGMSYPLGNR